MRIVNIVNSIKNNAKEYCYKVYGDNLFMEEYVSNLVKGELKELGILNGEDEMVWKSPDKSLFFEVSRDYSTSKLGSEGGYKYICTINIKNNIGIPISVIKFTELDAVRILSRFVDFTTPDYYYSEKNIVYIDINPSTTTLERYTIILENIKLENLDNVLFRINKYNPFQNITVNVVTIMMTHEQLNDLAFHLFFSLLIDIEIPNELDEEVFRIEDYVTTENYYTFAKRRQELEHMKYSYPEKERYAQSYINDNNYLINQRFSEAPMNNVIMSPNKMVQLKPLDINSNKTTNIKNKNITIRR